MEGDGDFEGGQGGKGSDSWWIWRSGEGFPSDKDEEGKDDADAGADANASFANSDTYVPKVDEGTELEMDGSTRNIVPAPPPHYPGDSAAFFPPPAAPPI